MNKNGLRIKLFWPGAVVIHDRSHSFRRAVFKFFHQPFFPFKFVTLRKLSPPSVGIETRSPARFFSMQSLNRKVRTQLFHELSKTTYVHSQVQASIFSYPVYEIYSKSEIRPRLVYITIAFSFCIFLHSFTHLFIFVSALILIIHVHNV